MVREFNNFWNENRIEKLKNWPKPCGSFSFSLHSTKETPKIDERPTIAGVYLNRLSKRMKLQADPTIVYVIRRGFDKKIRRVLYKDLG